MTHQIRTQQCEQRTFLNSVIPRLEKEFRETIRPLFAPNRFFCANKRKWFHEWWFNIAKRSKGAKGCNVKRLKSFPFQGMSYRPEWLRSDLFRVLSFPFVTFDEVKGRKSGAQRSSGAQLSLVSAVAGMVRACHTLLSHSSPFVNKHRFSHSDFLLKSPYKLLLFAEESIYIDVYSHTYICTYYIIWREKEYIINQRHGSYSCV